MDLVLLAFLKLEIIYIIHITNPARNLRESLDWSGHYWDNDTGEVYLILDCRSRRREYPVA